MAAPFVNRPTNDQRDPRREDLEFCPDCQHFAWRDKGHDCPGRPRMAWRGPLVGLTIMLITILMVLALLWIAFSPNSARGATPKPIPIPASHATARAKCPTLLACRAALIHAIEAVEWQRHERLHQGAYGVQHAIRLASALYGVPLSEMNRVSTCESHQHARSKNRHSTASGLFQFLDSTWTRAGIPGFSVFDPYANAIAAARLVTRDGGWREWSCQP